MILISDFRFTTYEFEIANPPSADLLLIDLPAEDYTN